MAEVPSLFDMDDDGELANIREICMPGQSVRHSNDLTQTTRVH